MSMTRRQFAQSLGAGALLLPFLPRPAAAANPVRRVVFVISNGTREPTWTPTSAPGSPLVLSSSMTPLQEILKYSVLLNGVGYLADPTETHGTMQAMAGFSNSSPQNATSKPESIDYWLGKRIGTTTKLPNLALGWQSKDMSFLYDAGKQRAAIDDPSNAFQTAFGTSSLSGSGNGSIPSSTFPRSSILDLVSGQVKALQKNLGTDAATRMGYHLDSLAQLQKSLSSPALVTGPGCNPMAPNLGGKAFDADASVTAVLKAQADIIVSALSCDVTRVATMQLGTNQKLNLPNPTGGILDAHGGGAHGNDRDAITMETYLATWFKNLVLALKAAPDAVNNTGSMLDNTMVVWLRDMGDGTNHSTYSTYMVLAGGTDYLKTASTGSYLHMVGRHPAMGASVVGPSHMRVLLNMAEFAGVSNFAGFGDFAKDPSQRAPLPNIKKG